MKLRLGPCALAVPLCAGLLAACSAIGEGSGPTGVVIRYNGVEGDLQTFECSAPQLSAVAIFNADGAVTEGDVTSRVVWSSSNPGVIDISNGDIETEPGSGQYFANGTLIARTAGSAVIRVDYIGFTNTFSVNAATILDLSITPQLTRLVPGSTQTFKLEATLSDDEPALDITSAAVWQIPSGSVPVSITGTSTVQAVSNPLDQPFTLEAQLSVCDRRAQLELQLGQVSELAVSGEQPADLPIPFGYTDELQVEAHFADASAPPQNLETQLTIEQVLGDADEATLVPGEDVLTLTGLKLNRPVQYRLQYEPLEISTLTRVFEFSELELEALRVDPESLDLIYPATAQLQAYGLFADGYERPVRRSVAWVSLDTDLVSVVASGTDAGELTPQRLDGNATVEASVSSSTGTLHDDVEVRVSAP
jgi:hypothetical protein